jgi:hypothetical protein
MIHQWDNQVTYPFPFFCSLLSIIYDPSMGRLQRELPKEVSRDKTSLSQLKMPVHNPSNANTTPEGHKASDSITIERSDSEQIDTEII